MAWYLRGGASSHSKASCVQQLNPKIKTQNPNYSQINTTRRIYSFTALEKVPWTPHCRAQIITISSTSALFCCATRFTEQCKRKPADQIQTGAMTSSQYAGMLKWVLDLAINCWESLIISSANRKAAEDSGCGLFRQSHCWRCFEFPEHVALLETIWLKDDYFSLWNEGRSGAIRDKGSKKNEKKL